MKRQGFLTILFLLAVIINVRASEADSVVLVNTGKMHIKANGNTTMFVKRAMRTSSDSCNIRLQGRLDVGGNFYQDAATHAFDTTLSGTPADTGTFAFVRNIDTTRQITTTRGTFDRDVRYIAFPNILIDTDDSIAASAQMAMDARSIHLAGNKNGALILRAETTGNAVNIASLRIPESGESGSLADRGSVVVENDWTLYRNDASKLFGFASPFKNTQLAGYFAGNWVRRPQADSYAHTTYPLGNKPKSSGSSEINSDQYITKADAILQVGQAYLIKPRPSGFDYGSLQAQGGLYLTGAEANQYDRLKFSFDGSVYTITPYKEQLFADDNLFSYTFASTSNPNKTLNWVIGNSYTSAISIKRLAEKILLSDLVFSPIIYVFPVGSTSYQPLNIIQTGDEVVVQDIDEIPAMSIFMIRVSKNQGGSIAAGTSFSIGKDLLVHGSTPHNVVPLRAATTENAPKRAFNNQVLLRTSLAENSSVYDLAAVGLRSDASLGSDSYDMSKLYTAARDGFQLYTLSETASKLSANGVPTDVESISVGFKPAATNADIVLRVEGTESLTSEALWLEDLLTGEKTDLFANPQYKFSSQPTDREARFVLHFRNIGGTTTSAENSQNENGIIMYETDGQVIIDRLSTENIGSKGFLYDAAGRLVSAFEITSYPKQTAATGLQAGVYLLHLQGKENISKKIIINQTK
ncbi:MAG: T9SS type A sorting domain-containing protein [Prevotellaceae bacterium]|jgi:hypothetical protein|nr:T9SS type A sorting domain-containing protein [Prevotellaceae bacterium]